MIAEIKTVPLGAVFYYRHHASDIKSEPIACSGTYLKCLSDCSLNKGLKPKHAEKAVGSPLRNAEYDVTTVAGAVDPGTFLLFFCMHN
jgi:hypothetical protein